MRAMKPAPAIRYRTAKLASLRSKGMILAAIRGCEQARHELDDVCTRYSVAQDATKDAANEAAKRADYQSAKRKVKRADEVLARLCRSWSRDTVSDNDALVLAAAIAAHTRINEASYLEVREFARPVFDALDNQWIQCGARASRCTGCRC